MPPTQDPPRQSRITAHFPSRTPLGALGRRDGLGDSMVPSLVLAHLCSVNYVSPFV